MTPRRFMLVSALIFWAVLSLVSSAVAQESPKEPVVYKDLAFPKLPYPSHWIEVNGIKIHYMETGDPNADPILLLHGTPAWSYIWRNVMPELEKSGHVIALDFPGYGRSDKLDRYSTKITTEYLTGFIEEMKLKNITLVVQDIGSMAGLSFASTHEDLVKQIVLLEAAIPPAFPMNFDNLLASGVAGETWQLMATDGAAQEVILNQNLFIETILPLFVLRPLSDEEINAYKAPVPNPEDRLVFLSNGPGQILYGTSVEEVTTLTQHYIDWLTQTDKRVLMLYATPGVFGDAAALQWAKDNIHNLETVSVGAGSHFFQEDHPHEVAQAIAAWINENER